MNNEPLINWIIENLWQGSIELSEQEAEALHEITGGQFNVVDGVLLVDAGNADMIYHVLVSYLSKMEVS